MLKKTKVHRKKKSLVRKEKIPTRGYGPYKTRVPKGEKSMSERVWELLEDMDALGDSIDRLLGAGIGEIELMIIEANRELWAIRTKIESLVDA